MPIQTARPDPSAALAGLGAPPVSTSRTPSPAPGGGFAAVMKQAQSQGPSSPVSAARAPEMAGRQAEPGAHAKEPLPRQDGSRPTQSQGTGEPTDAITAGEGRSSRLDPAVPTAPKARAKASVGKPGGEDKPVTSIPPADDSSSAELVTGAVEIPLNLNVLAATERSPGDIAPVGGGAGAPTGMPLALSPAVGPFLNAEPKAGEPTQESISATTPTVATPLVARPSPEPGTRVNPTYEGLPAGGGQFPSVPAEELLDGHPPGAAGQQGATVRALSVMRDTGGAPRPTAATEELSASAVQAAPTSSTRDFGDRKVTQSASNEAQGPKEPESLASSLSKPSAKVITPKTDPTAADSHRPPVAPTSAGLPAAAELTSALRTASGLPSRADTAAPIGAARSGESALAALAWAPGATLSAPGPVGADSVASAALAPPPGHPDFADALSTQVAVWVGKGVQEAQLQLNPRDMGPVQVWIAVDNASAQVRFSAEHGATRDALQAALPELAQALARDGIQLGGASVQTSDTGGFAQPRQQGDGSAGGRRAFLPPDGAGTGPAPARAIGRPGTNLLDLYA